MKISQIPIRRIALITLAFFIISSCVPMKKFQELETQYNECQEESARLRKENENLLISGTEMAAEIEKLRKQLADMEKEMSRHTEEYTALEKRYNELNESYTLLVENSSSQMAKNAEENRRLLAEMALLEEKLRAKEDSLRIRENELNTLSAELQKREKRVNELEAAMARKDSIMNSLTARMREALLGYEGKGLTIEERNGKLYITLENSLLFASGKWEVNENGKKAIEQLADVLAGNPDINILIEGHTDTDAFYGGQVIRDNWDLSVMRATAVVKILQGKGVSPRQMTAAGRSEYLPVASNDNDKGKAQNRRIEIILEPDLGQLMELLRNE